MFVAMAVALRVIGARGDGGSSFWRGEPFGLMPGGFPARPLRLIANVPHVFMG